MQNAYELQFSELKDTISQLNNTVAMQNELLTSLKAQLAEKDAEKAELNVLIKNLQAEVAYLKKKLFGSSSEKHDAVLYGQMSMFGTDDEDIKPPEIIDAECFTQASLKKARKPKATYDEMFAGLKSTKVYVDTLTDEEKRCPLCGTELKSIGHELIRTELQYHPATLERIDYYSTTYGCPKCKKDATEIGDGYFIKDEGIPALIPGSYASESVAAWTMYQKFCNSMPFERQSKDMKQYGVNIGRSTMASWAIYCTEHYLKPMYDFYHRELLKRNFLMADETPVQVLKEEGRRPETKSYMWLFRTGNDGLKPIILYYYSPTRAGSNASDFLKGINPGTYLTVDGYQGYNSVEGVKICNCWAHVRRYLLEAIPTGKEKDFNEPAVQGFLYVESLFSYERQYREKGLTPNQIYKRRLKDEKPILEGFWRWFDRVAPIKGTRLYRAMNYIQNRRPNLETYLEDGHCSFSNNWSENSIRPVTVGRKNWMFSDSVAGADANAVILSMVEMAKAYELNIYEYLKFILEARPNSKMSDEDLASFAPWNEEIQKRCRNSIK